MAPDPKVTIVLPTHNRPVLLDRAIQSVYAQSMTEWQLVIVADDCTGETDSVVQSVISDERIIFLKTDRNVGGGGARNLGMRKARGHFIAFLDDDDAFLPDKLAMQVAFLETNPDVDLVSCDRIIVAGSCETRTHLPPRIELQEEMISNLCGSFSFCLLRRSALQNLEIDETLRACQDWDFWIRFLNLSGNACGVCQTSLVRSFRHYGERLSTRHGAFRNGLVRFLRKHWDGLTPDQQRNMQAAIALSRIARGGCGFRTTVLLISKFLRMKRLVGCSFSRSSLHDLFVALFDSTETKRRVRDRLLCIAQRLRQARVRNPEVSR